MGVYGNLGIGLMLFCLAGISKGVGWNDRPLKWAFWSINIGLMAMIVMSLFPIGLVQFIASVEHGYWFARSPEIMQGELVQSLVWNRVWGDVIFGIGGVLLGYFIFGLIKGAISNKKTEKAPVGDGLAQPESA